MTIYSFLTSSHYLSIAPSTTPTSYFNGNFPPLFSYTNHLEHQVCSCHPTPSSLSIPPANTQQNRLKTCLRLKPKISFFHIYCTNVYLLYRLHMCTVTTKNVTMGTTSRHSPPQHISIPSNKMTRDVSRALGRFFFSPFFYDTNIYL